MGERTELHDDDWMPIGKWRGERLGDVPDHYWRWFVSQDWAQDKYPDLFEYAQLVEDEIWGQDDWWED
jgi:uncharacterized protein (DUF3820 family)